MTSPREQAIEEAAKAIFLEKTGLTNWEVSIAKDNFRRYARRAIDAYEQARARLDGAKMMPREATDAMCRDGAAKLRAFYDEDGPYPRTRAVYRAMHDATPKEKE